MAWNKFIGFFVGTQGFIVFMCFLFLMESGSINMGGIHELLNYLMLLIGLASVLLAVFMWNGSKASHTIVTIITLIVIALFVTYSIADFSHENQSLLSSIADIFFYLMLLLPPVFILALLQHPDVKKAFGK